MYIRIVIVDLIIDYIIIIDKECIELYRFSIYLLNIQIKNYSVHNWTSIVKLVITIS